MIRARRHDQQGSAVATAILVLFMISLLIAIVGTGALSSMVNSRTKGDHSVGMAAGDSGIEKYRAALQAHLADESNNYELGQAALTQLISDDPGAVVLPNSATSDRWKMAPAKVPGPFQYTVREQYDKTFGYWQVYSVVMPRFARVSPPSEVTVYIRAWVTSNSASPSMTTDPKVFRVQFRPGYFSDYQTVSDAPIFFDSNATVQINGPMHSNGFDVQTFLATDSGAAGGVVHRGIYINPGPASCGPFAQFSTSNGAAIVAPGAPCAGATRRQGKARPISLLGVEDSIRYMQTRCGTLVLCAGAQFPTNANGYDVTLGTNQITVNGRRFGMVAGIDSKQISVLADGNVRLRGAASAGSASIAARVTVATHRPNPADTPPDVVVRGVTGGRVGSSDPLNDSVGIISQGNVILDVPGPASPGTGCMRALNVAAIAESGSVTIPPVWTTLAPPATNLNGHICNGGTLFNGAFAGHGQMETSIFWTQATGRTPTIGFAMPTMSYNRTLFTNPPPFFPLATPWGVSEVKPASDNCLINRWSDPKCT